jgi:hypothetical protein
VSIHIDNGLFQFFPYLLSIGFEAQHNTSINFHLLESFFQLPDSFFFLLILLTQTPDVIFIGTHECNACDGFFYGIFLEVPYYRNLCED